MKPFALELMCDLTVEELNTKAQELSTASIRFDEVEDAKRTVTKEYNDELKALRGTMRQLSETIRQKQEARLVDCTVRLHVPEVGMKRITRMDTGAIVRDEPMTLAERQTTLFEEEIGDLNKLYGGGAEDEPPQEAGS